VRVNIRAVEGSTFFERVDKSDFAAAIMGWRLDLDPDVFDTFHSAMAPPNGLNYGHYANARVDSLLVAGRREFDQTVRARIYHEVHRLVHEDEPYTFINSVPDKRPIAKRINGVKIAWSGPYDFWPGASYWWVDDAPARASGP
jgi:peptide/nickel transport system substrate-binding protein